VKRVVLFLLLISMVFVISHPSMARGYRDKHRLNWGASIGFNLTNASGSWTDIVGYDRKMDTGIAASLFGAINVTNHFALRSELHFGRKGFVLEGDVNQAAQTLNPFAYYIDVPILVEWDFIPKNYVSFQTFAGPSFGYLMKDGMGIEIPGKKNAQAREITNFNSVDLGFIVGIRMSFPAGRTSDRGYLELRFNQSLNSFIEDTDVKTMLINGDATKVTMGGPGSPDAKHQVFTISLGMILD
jgi:Outer membrane protein beta-barrel domain